MMNHPMDIPDAHSGLDHRTAVLLVTISAACALFFLRFRPSIQLLPPDAAGFINWEVTRTPAYPAFLRAVSLLSSDLRVVTFVQLVVFSVSTVIFTMSAARLIRNRALSSALALSITANPQLVRYCFTILAESLFISFIMLHLAAVLTALRAPNPRRERQALAAAGVTLAIVILIKPAGYSLLASLPVLLYAFRKRLQVAVPYLVAPMAVLLLIACAANYVVHGVFATQAFGGYSLVGHVAILLDDQTKSTRPELASRIAERLRGIEAAFKSIDSIRPYYLLSANEYNRIEWDIVIPLIRVFVDQHVSAEAAESRQQREINEISRHLAVEAIRTHPARYLYHVAAHLYGLWFLPNVRAGEDAASDDASLRAVQMRLPALTSAPIVFITLPRLATVPIKAALVSVFALSLGWLMMLVLGSGRPAMVFPLAYASAVVHTNYLLVGAVQSGLPRYALSLWPVQMLILFGSAAAALQLALNSGRVSRGSQILIR